MMADICLGLAIGYLVGTYLESFYHDRLQHGHKSVNSSVRAFARARASHETVHHRMTFRTDHVTQFTSEEERSRVDAFLDAEWPDMADAVKRESYGVGLGLWGVAQFALALFPPLLLVWPLVGHAATVASLFPVCLVPLLSSKVHRYLHMPYECALKEASWPARLLLRSWYGRRVWRHHWMHHRYVRCNYNLLMGGDWLRGVHREPAPRDIARMAAIGLPVH
jgi:hypothetical protein